MEIEEKLDSMIKRYEKQNRGLGCLAPLPIVINDLKELKQSLPPEQETTEFPEHIVKYLDTCNSRNKPLIEVIGKAKYHDPDYIYWTEEETRNIAIAYSTGNYTVKKEPLYYVVFNKLGGNNSDCYLWMDEFNNDYVYFCNKPNMGKNKFTEQEIKAIDERYWAFAVPVEEEAE